MSNSTAIDNDNDDCAEWVAGWWCSIAIFLSLPIIFSFLEYAKLLDWVRIPVHKKAYENFCERIMKCTFSGEDGIAYGISTCLPMILSPQNYKPPEQQFRGSQVNPTDEKGHYKFFYAPPEFKAHLDSSNLYNGGIDDPSKSKWSLMHYGWGQDYLQHIFNEHIILQNFLGDAYQNYSPVKRRVALWCTQTLAFLFAAVFANNPSRTILNIFVVCPLILLIHTYVYYMLVCPCLQTRTVAEEEKRKTSVWRICCDCLQCCGVCSSGVWVLMGFIWLLIYHASNCRDIDQEYWNTLLEYLYSVFVTTTFLDLFLRSRLFLLMPIKITVCGQKIDLIGSYYFEKEEFGDLPEYIKSEGNFCCCLSLCTLRKRRIDEKKIIPMDSNLDGLEMGTSERSNHLPVVIQGNVVDTFLPEHELQPQKETMTRGKLVPTPSPSVVSIGQTPVNRQVGGID